MAKARFAQLRLLARFARFPARSRRPIRRSRFVSSSARARRARARDRPEADRDLGTAGRRRPAAGRGRHHRRRYGREVGPGRLHAAAHDGRLYDQRGRLSQAPVQPRARPRAGGSARGDLLHRHRQSIGAREIDAGARAARARQAGRAQLRALGSGHHRASRLRDAQAQRRRSTSSPCPTKARSRRSST